MNSERMRSALGDAPRRRGRGRESSSSIGPTCRVVYVVAQTRSTSSMCRPSSRFTSLERLARPERERVPEVEDHRAHRCSTSHARAHVGLGRPRVADREPQDVAAVEPRVRDEDLAGRVHALEQRLVLLVRALAPEADDRERPRRARAPSRARRAPTPRRARRAARARGSSPAGPRARSSAAPPTAAARGTAGRAGCSPR